MYELVHIAGSSYYIQSPAKIGLVRLGDCDSDRVCLIDSGNDKDAGRKVRQILDKNGWKLGAIYNTHSHADHIGGNKYLQAQTGCRVYSHGIECCFTRHTSLEPAFLFGGFPVEELTHKFLMAQESIAEPLTPESLPEGFELIDLPGHFFDMIGIRTPDDVIFLADCLASRETIEKYRIVFIYDVAAYLSTLEKVKTLNANYFVPSHAELTDNIFELAQYNIESVNNIANDIVNICSSPLNFESILQRLFTLYNLSMNFEQYVLVGSTVKSFLSWLKAQGRVRAFFDDSILLWESE
ncbi:MAG: MBL fold metallo-hydrolase [Synergistaceae bacterium]|nr:MBL fold metallo-hydrolase [Synergistaceae bacterium]